MPVRSSEVVKRHSRLLKVALEVEHSRSFWQHHRSELDAKTDADIAFSEFWFGTRSYAAVQTLLSNFRHRFESFPNALAALAQWSSLELESCKLICHWHLQLSDPVYRQFSGEFLVQRRASLRGSVTRDAVVAWMDKLDTERRWTKASHIQFASKLLSAAHGAGLVGSAKDPRPAVLPKVPDAALGYLLRLLREVEFEGQLHDNLYLRSVGLEGRSLDDRLRSLPGVTYRRISEVVDFEWVDADLVSWVRGLS
ncbi:MAG: hypothetical protein V3V08_26015 [Nannocystaceae bacterium]